MGFHVRQVIIKAHHEDVLVGKVGVEEPELVAGVLGLPEAGDANGYAGALNHRHGLVRLAHLQSPFGRQALVHPNVEKVRFGCLFLDHRLAIQDIHPALDALQKADLDLAEELVPGIVRVVGQDGQGEARCLALHHHPLDRELDLGGDGIGDVVANILGFLGAQRLAKR